jgi:hypothetical protein
MSDLDLTKPYDPDDYKPRQPGEPGPRALPSPPSQSAVPGPGAAPSLPEAAPPAGADQGPVPWKAAASSIPRLRQQPAPVAEPPGGEAEFPGFAQDRIDAGGADEAGESARARRSSPLAAEVPLWEVWLERVRAIPRPIAIGAIVGVVAVFCLVSFLRERAEGLVSLKRVRQHPEAYDGRVINVRGKAGETFTMGASYVFNLRQGRDTIVVYSRTRRPRLHETVRATGIVSIGYLDGAPRVALFEQDEQPTP